MGIIGAEQQAGAASLFALSHTDSAITTNHAGHTTETFSARAFGAVASGSEVRYIVVCVAGLRSSSTGTVSSVTIGGVSATEVIKTTGSISPAGIFIAAVPTGTTGDVVVTMDTNIVSLGIDIFRLISPSSATAFGTASTIINASGVVTLDCNIPSGGAAIAVVSIRNDSSATIGWSGLTEDTETDISEGGFDYMGTAHGGSAGSPAAITATFSDTSPQITSGCVASWGP